MRGLVAKTTGPVVMIKGLAWIIREIRVIRVQKRFLRISCVPSVASVSFVAERCA